ncbi:hemolysin III family protein [Spirochaetota bacterium]
MSDLVYENLGPQKKPYPLGEEIANAISHGLWALLSIAGLVILVVKAAMHGSAWHIVSFSIFGSSAVLLFTMSTLYHAISAPRAKRVLKILDHSSIYVLIAGTYTPFALTILRPSMGWMIFGIIWGLAALGISLKPFLAGKAKALSTIAYVAMGWIIIIAWKPLNAVATPYVVRMLILGGVTYTLGALFYMLKGRVWSHPLWHLFVGAGATFHFFSVLGLLP